MSRPILYVMDDPRWIQGSRLEVLRRLLPELTLEAATPRSLALRLGLRRRSPVYLASWRLLHALRGRIDLARTMVSVTSHYELGGGLAPDKALRRGTDPESSLAIAAELLSACAVVTVNSSPLYELLSPHVHGLIYAPNGVDHRFFTPAPHTYDAEHPRVGWAGKRKAAKNVEALDAAADMLRSEGFAFELVGGDKADEKPLDAAGMRDFYRRLDWYLCASWHEGTPNPALEAAASGVPIVSTRVGNMVDLVRHGENGFFVEPTAESIVETLRAARTLAPEDHARMARAARASVEADWTWERNVAPYREAFDRLLHTLGR